MSVFRRKLFSQIATQQRDRQLVRSLRWPHLIALGIGAIVGTGIYTLIGVGANLAGPGFLLSFLIAGIICACTALAYAELSTMIPVAGSTYTYTYLTLGEPIAWIVGWSLILEYSLVVSTVAVGWSGYFVGFLDWIHQVTGIHCTLPTAWTAGPHAGGIFNLPAVVITLIVAAVLINGTRKSATFNIALVIIKLLALVLFILVTVPSFQHAHFIPFMPYGFSGHIGPDHVKRGVMAAAAIVFFAFYGFDAISTAAEETQNPKRHLTIGIIGSMVCCTLIYMAVGAAAIGAVPYELFSASSEPLALILRYVHQDWAAAISSTSAVIALPTVIFAFMYGQTRVFFVMSRDGLLPRQLSMVNKKTGTPIAVTSFTAFVVAILAGLVPLDEVAALANTGTLVAFTSVSLCMLVLRVTESQRPRLFRAPLAWLIGPVAILGCIYLFFNLPTRTQQWFVKWNSIGLIVYLAYGRWHSVLNKKQAN